MRHKKVKFVPIVLAAFVCGAVANAALLKPGDFHASGPAKGKRLAVTFDDGPGVNTEKFLDLLDRYHVKATFFVLSNKVKNHPEVAKMLVARGHEIADHTTRHDNYKLRLKELKEKDPQTAEAKATSELIDDMKKSRAVIESTLGVKLRFLRMPYGADGPWIHNAAREAGFVLVNWTWGADWDKDPAEKLIPGYVNALKPGAIILLHDGWPKSDKSLAITEAVLKAAQEKGYEVMTVGKLLGD
jgi:peptidoglycan/xylan/chitin deacetylase (PgdA/CDA1 family)